MYTTKSKDWLHPISQIAQDLKIKEQQVNTLLRTLQNNIELWNFSVKRIANFLLEDFYTNPKIEKKSLLIKNGIEEKLVNRFYEALLWPVTPWDSWKYMTTKKTIEKLMPVFNQLQ